MISAENKVDKTGIFWLLLSGACTASRAFLLLTLPPVLGMDEHLPEVGSSE